MTNRYYVTYDICDPRRLRRVFQVLKGVGEHVQDSHLADLDHHLKRP